MKSKSPGLFITTLGSTVALLLVGCGSAAMGPGPSADASAHDQPNIESAAKTQANLPVGANGDAARATRTANLVPQEPDETQVKPERSPAISKTQPSNQSALMTETHTKTTPAPARAIWDLLGFSDIQRQHLSSLGSEDWQRFDHEPAFTAASVSTLKLLRDYFIATEDAARDAAMDKIRRLARDGVAEAQYLIARKIYEDSAISEIAGDQVDLTETETLIQASMWLNAAADAGFPPALRDLGDAFLHGWGMPVEPELAHDLYFRAAESGDQLSCLRLMDLCNRESMEQPDVAVMAWLLEETRDLHNEPMVLYFAARHELISHLELPQSVQDLSASSDHNQGTQAIELPASIREKIETASRAGYAPACFHYYFLLTSDNSDPVTAASARDFLEQAAESGLLAAQLELASVMEQTLGENPESLVVMEKWLRRAAIQDPVDAQTVLGQFEEIHRKDPLNAFAHYLDSAMRGGRRGRFHLGRLLLEQPEHFDEMLGNAAGEGLSQIRNAAERDDPDACYYLADFQLQSVEETGIAEPIRWLTAAAEQDHLEAQKRLGQIYWNGTGLSRPNPVVAIRWLVAAADQGDLNSLRLLEQAYRDGIGTLPDLAMANELKKSLEEFSHEE